MTGYKKEKRDKRLEIRLTASEQEMLQYVCDNAGLTASQFLRAVILKYYHQGGSF